MQRGTCFINYEDFRECFTAYKEETRSTYSIQSSVSVRYHNRKFSANIRPDIIFTEVKFCCSKLHGPHGKRRPQDDICPAYFFLQYDTDLDRLVVKEVCSTHVHSKNTNPPPANIIPPPETVEENPPSDSEVPSKKICNEQLPPSPEKQNDPEEDGDMPDMPSPCEPQSNVPLEPNDAEEDHSKPTSTTTEDPAPEELSPEATTRLVTLIRDFQNANIGSKTAMTVGDQKQFEQLCFQTCSMSSWFLKFPESLLLHRVSSKIGFVLYAFLVETKERMGKIVHFSFVKEDNVRNISQMLEMLKYFNESEWPKVKVIYIDTAFEQTDILKEAFPSVQVLLSVYHTAHFIEKKIKGSADFKYCVHNWIDETIHHTTTERLNFLVEKLEHRLDQDLLAKLRKDWFSNELLWYMHVKKGELACGTYMDSMGLIDQTIASCLAKETSMENSVREFLKSADRFNSKGLEKQKIGFPVFSHKASKAQPKIAAKKQRSILPPSSSDVPTQPLNNKKKNKKKTCSGFVRCPKSSVWRPIRLANKMLLSLKEFCNDVGFQLCLKEWDSVQKSTYLSNALPGFTNIQILEETHNVSLRDLSCTCYFNKDCKLPCRHILSMLHAYKKPVEEKMVSVRWRKDYVKPLSDFRVYAAVTVYSNHNEGRDKIMERMGKIKNLEKEFYNLLTQCDGQEMQTRISTLQTIVGLWGSDSSSEDLYPAQDRAPELPYRWVEREPVEGENGFGYELCRVDPELP